MSLAVFDWMWNWPRPPVQVNLSPALSPTLVGSTLIAPASSEPSPFCGTVVEKLAGVPRNSVYGDTTPLSVKNIATGSFGSAAAAGAAFGAGVAAGAAAGADDVPPPLLAQPKSTLLSAERKVAAHDGRPRVPCMSVSCDEVPARRPSVRHRRDRAGLLKTLSRRHWGERSWCHRTLESICEGICA
jgi:hypothetical protein